MTTISKEDEYNYFIRKQYALNLPSHAFFTANDVLELDTCATLQYPQLKLRKTQKEWIDGYSNEIGRLVNGVHPRMMNGSNPIHFILPSQNLANRTAIYLRIVVNYRPQKDYPYCICFTVGGN